MVNKKITIEEVEKAFGEVYLLEDKGVVRITLAAVVANRLFTEDRPVWLLLLAGSSSGKTAILQTLDGIGKWIIPIDTLTTNTFASGLARSEETSLLHKANRGVMVFKDMTTLTNMNEEALREIMGQLRAIYDGSFDKKTGNNQDITWSGKIGIIAGGTIAVQRKMRQFSEQGERFINYCISQPNSIDMTTRAVQNQETLKAKEDGLKVIVRDFVNQTLAGGMIDKLTIPQELEREIIKVSDFATLARSPVIMDKKTNRVSWVPEREQPPRMALQLINLAKSLMIMSGEKELSEKNAAILYQCAMDSIPADRRIILRNLTKYKSASTKNLAIHLGYPTDAVNPWCAQLNARKMVDRVAKGDGASDTWVLKQEYREIVQRYEAVTALNEDLIPSENEVQGAIAEPQGEFSNSDETLLSQIEDEFKQSGF